MRALITILILWVAVGTYGQTIDLTRGLIGYYPIKIDSTIDENSGNRGDYYDYSGHDGGIVVKSPYPLHEHTPEERGEEGYSVLSPINGFMPASEIVAVSLYFKHLGHSTYGTLLSIEPYLTVSYDGARSLHPTSKPFTAQGRFIVQAYDPYGTTEEPALRVVSSQVTLQDQEAAFHHLYMEHDPKGKTLLYIDGKKIGEGSAVNPFTYTNCNRRRVALGALLLKQYQEDEYESPFPAGYEDTSFGSVVDEIRFYNRPLTEAEITFLADDLKAPLPPVVVVNPTPKVTTGVEISLLAWKEADQARLRWSVAKNHPTCTFVLQDSSAHTSWQNTPVECSRKDSLNKYYYEASHYPDGQTTYYRVEIIMEDGAIQRSGLVHVAFTRADPLPLRVYPNPASGTVEVDSQEGEVQLYDMQGSLYSQPFDGKRMDLTGVPKGLYLLTNGKETVRIQVE